jgi:hypothetical protein
MLYIYKSYEGHSKQPISQIIYTREGIIKQLKFKTTHSF